VDDVVVEGPLHRFRCACASFPIDFHLETDLCSSLSLAGRQLASAFAAGGTARVREIASSVKLADARALRRGAFEASQPASPALLTSSKVKKTLFKGDLGKTSDSEWEEDPFPPEVPLFSFVKARSLLKVSPPLQGLVRLRRWTDVCCVCFG